MLGTLSREALMRSAQRPVLSDRTRTFDGAALNDWADRLAAGLAGRYRPGERIVLFMANSLEFVALQLAAERAGLVRVPVNRFYRADELVRVVAACGASVIFHDASTVDRVSATGTKAIAVECAEFTTLADTARCVLPTVPPDALCSLGFTSGTTGRPKGVMMTHRQWTWVYANMLADRDIRRDDRMLHIGPLTHASGAYLMPHIMRGSLNVLVDMNAPQDLFEAVERWRATVFTCVPTVLTRLVGDGNAGGADLSSLRRIAYGAEPMPANTLIGATALFGPILVQNYGLTEAMMTVCYADEAAHTAPGFAGSGVIGRPYTFVEVELRDAAGRPVGEGAAGELTIRSGQVMTGYWNLPEETAAVLSDGWLRSGDLAVREGDGTIRLVGRAKDLVISGGFNIYPAEIEAWLCRAPGVVEAAVLGMPDPKWGEALVAVVAGPSLGAEALGALAAAARAALGYKAPKRWELREALPRTANGKLDKAALRAQLAA